MLILSRREKQKILFPEQAISIEIAGVKGKTVRLGIEAPREIRVIRSELADSDESDLASAYSDKKPIESKIQNRLDDVYLALHLAQNQLHQRDIGRAGQALDDAFDFLEKLELFMARQDLLSPAKLNSQPHGSPSDELSVQESRSSYRLDSQPDVIPFAEPIMHSADLKDGCHTRYVAV